MTKWGMKRYLQMNRLAEVRIIAYTPLLSSLAGMGPSCSWHSVAIRHFPRGAELELILAPMTVVIDENIS
jgi:hypothetical protein